MRAGASSSAPEGRDASKNAFTIHYNALLANLTEAVEAMNNKIAAGLSQLVADYLATKAQ